MQEENNNDNFVEKTNKEGFHKSYSLSGMYKDWFLDYASYVILERAVPSIKDGLKPVQRRILHAMRELDDGRYNKVANLIGHTMKYHPHGDASIGNALVALGQKDLLIDTQGNWGNILTGDSAAAPRYIEARLSEFAKAVVFNPKTTEWASSYDGRNKEPVNLPVKFPLLLAQGVEGIAVGLASKVLPHNFIELLDASIAVLEEREFVLYPDFQTGGMIDVSRYNDGKKGSRVRVRSRIGKVDKKTLVITEIPYTQTTNSVIDSIISANDKGKIKIKKIDDNTAENVEIIIHLNTNVSIDQTIDALYAFTNCEVSISPNACVIQEDAPRFLGVSDILKQSVELTKQLLYIELDIRKGELMEKILFSSLEKIFIENRIYRKIESCETYDEIIQTIDKGLDPYKKDFYREVTKEDIVRLTQIQIKRISRYDAFKADEILIKLEEELNEVQYHMDNLIPYSIAFYQKIKDKFSKGKERKTEIRDFENIEASMAAVANEKLYFDAEAGFAGTGLKKASFITECSDIDDIIVFRADGTYVITKVDEKVYVGKDVLHIDVFKKNDDRTIYNAVYRDGLHGRCYVKRFAVTSCTRDKEYNLTQGKEKSKVLYFTANPNGEAEVIRVSLYPRARMKNTSFDYDFSELVIKGRSARGNILSRYPIRKITKKEDGISTLGGVNIWLDDNVKRLNTDEYGTYLGSFKGDDKIISFYGDKYFQTYGYDLSVHFEEDMSSVEKFDANTIYTVVYYNGEKKNYYVKRFQAEISDKPMQYLDEHKDTKIILFTKDKYPQIELEFDNENKRKERENEVLLLADFIDVKSYKAMGNRLSRYDIDKINILESLPEEEEKETPSQPDIEQENQPVKDNPLTKNQENKNNGLLDLIFEDEEE